MAKCLVDGKRRQQGCTQYRDDGYNACDQWDKNCCDWWPCSMFCKIFTWICTAVVWISNIVCAVVGFVFVAFCLIWDTVISIVNAVVESVESIVGWALSAIAFVISVFLAVPVIGRILRWIINIGESIGIAVAGAIDTVAGIIGIQPEKKMRICTIILCKEDGTPVVQPSVVVPWLQNVINIFRQQANIRVMNSAPFQYRTWLSDDEVASEDWIHVQQVQNPSLLLNLGGELAAFGGDLTVIGARFEAIANATCFYGAWRRLVGYGAPITIFIIETMEEGIARSIGAFADYVTVGAYLINTNDNTTVAHELGHANNLLHLPISSNLMFPNPSRGTNLQNWQGVLMRASRHVSYF